MRTDLLRFSDLVPFAHIEHNRPCESGCALRLRSKINKGIKGLFIFLLERVGNPDSHGLATVQLAGGNQE